MKSVKINIHELARQANKARIFARTSGSDDVYQRRNVTVSFGSERDVNITAHSCDSRYNRHVIADYKVRNLMSVNEGKVTVDAKELCDIAKHIAKTRPKTGEDANVYIRVSPHNTLSVDSTGVTDRPTPVDFGGTQHEIKHLCSLDKRHVREIKLNMVTVASKERHENTISSIHFKHGYVVATDRVCAARMPILPSFKGETLVNQLAFRHVKLSDAVSISAAPGVSVLETDCVRVYTVSGQSEKYPNLDKIFAERSEPYAQIGLQAKELTAELLRIQREHGKTVEIVMVQLGETISIVHGYDNKIVGEISGASVRTDRSASILSVDQTIKLVSNHNGTIRLLIPEDNQKPIKGYCDGYQLLLMRLQDSGTRREQAEKLVEEETKQ